MSSENTDKNAGSLRGSLYVLSAIFLWSSLGVVIRLSGARVHELIFYSNIISLIFLGALISRKRYRIHIPRGKNVLPLFLLGPVTLLNIFTFFYALQNTTISNALMTHYIAPVIVVFLAFVFLREPLTWKLIAAILISSAGLWILLGRTPIELMVAFADPGRDTLGIMSGLLSGCAYAVLVLLVRVFAQSYNPLVLTFFQNLIIFALLLPFVRGFPQHAIWSFIVMGVVHSTIAPVLYFRGLEVVRAGRAAILGYIEPVCAIVFGMIFLGEYPAMASLFGGGLILFSGYLTLKQEGQ
jgi:drug/metabolite transporter (DMT)-like permease